MRHSIRSRRIRRCGSICNNTAGAIAARVFFDDDGSTYGTAQALYYDKSVPANDTIIVDTKIYMYTASGTIGIRSATGSALTFTAFGQEIPT